MYTFMYIYSIMIMHYLGYRLLRSASWILPATNMLAPAQKPTIRLSNKGLVGAARPPSLLAGASLKYFTL